MTIARACLVGVVLLAAWPAPAAAQPTRAAEIAEAQAAKAANPPVDPPGRIERTVVALRRAAIESPSGPYPIADSVYNGGGAAVGVGYRQYVGRSDLPHLPRSLLREALRLGRGPGDLARAIATAASISGRRRRSWTPPRSATTGSVPTMTSPTAPTSVSVTPSSAGRRRCRPRWPLVVGASLAGEVFDIDSGHGSEPSIEESYDASTAPGLGLSPGYVHSSLSGAIDWRPAAGYARRGGNYGADLPPLRPQRRLRLRAARPRPRAAPAAAAGDLRAVGPRPGAVGAARRSRARTS